MNIPDVDRLAKVSAVTSFAAADPLERSPTRAGETAGSSRRAVFPSSVEMLDQTLPSNTKHQKHTGSRKVIEPCRCLVLLA